MSLSEFHNNVNNLDLSCARALASFLISIFPSEQKNALGFNNDVPLERWVKKFLGRHTELTLKRQVKLESEPQEEMNSYNIAKNSTRLHARMNKQEISDPTRILNLDESSFSICGMTTGRAK